MSDKIADLFGAIANLFPQRSPPQATLQRLKQEISETPMEDYEKYNGEALFGMVAGLEYNEAEFCRRFRLSHAFAKLEHIEMSYGALCRRLGYLDDATEAYWWLLEFNPGNSDAASGLLRTSLDLLNLEYALDAVDYIERVHHLKLGSEEASALEYLKFLDARLVARNITQSQVGARIKAATSILTKAKEPIFGSELRIGANDAMTYAFKIQANPHDADMLSAEIARMQKAKSDDALSQLLTVSCFCDRGSADLH